MSKHSTNPPRGFQPFNNPGKTCDPTHGKEKPAKPSADFPLYAHANGQWAKKIRGKTHFFGLWSDPDGALKRYEAEKDALLAGRKVRNDAPDALTVKLLCNRFMEAKQALVDSGELSQRTWDDYHEACEGLLAVTGKTRLANDLGPDDFATLRERLAGKCGPHRLGKMIQSIRTVFKHGFEADLLATPVRFGPGFKRPSAKTLRLHRAAQGPKLFTPEQIRALIAEARLQVKAMVLLAINCGLGNTDCGMLPLSALDLDAGWLDYPRPKTGVARRCPLWPETVEAIRVALEKRPGPKKEEDAGLVFLTRYGTPWAKENDPGVISKEFAKLAGKLNVPLSSFYALRHTFRTVADEARDQPAADFIMGHESGHMSTVYRERISDERLQAVSEHVRAWLFSGRE
jgi:integrase